MTIGRSGNRLVSRRRSMAKAQKLATSRKILLESLEARQLMAVGPTLLSVQPNEGSVISEGQVLQVSPKELVFRFNDSVVLDASTIANGIQISRAGNDGVFGRAYVSTDLGTSGAVVLDFAAVTAGQAGNGFQVSFTQSSRAGSSLPVLTVNDRSINIDVNVATGFKTTAQDILTAFRNNSAASAKLLVSRLRGSELTTVADTVPVAAPLVLTGATSARASSNLNAGGNVQVEFLATQVGQTGNNARLEVTSSDFGGAGLPIVTVSGQTVRIRLNSNLRNATTLQQFVTAINSDAAAAGVLQARIVSGSGATVVGSATINYSPITFLGVDDIAVTPAYIGLGDTGREVIVRFAEALPDDQYRVDILGTGLTPLRNVSGEAYNSGVNTSIGFELDLGALVQSVVPQPMTRVVNRLPQDKSFELLYRALDLNNDGLVSTTEAAEGSMIQAFDRIDVYFNSDQLNAADAVNPRFYQLRYTNTQTGTQDDLVVYPRDVKYDPAAGRVILTFAKKLGLLFGDAGANGAFRLRVGSTEGSQVIGSNFSLPANKSGPGIDTLTPLPFSAPVAPAEITADPGSRFSTAMNIAPIWNLTANNTGPSSIILKSEIKNTTPYNLDFPGSDSEPGNRKILYQQHVTRIDTDGIEVIEYNFQGILGAANGSNQLNAITEGQKAMVRQVLSLYENYLGVRFVETASRGFTVAVGDMRAINPTAVNGVGVPFSVTGPLLSNGQDATIIDIQDFNTAADNQFGSELFRTFARGIGNLLGLGTGDELPGLTVQSNISPTNPGIDTELVYPGNSDIVYGQYAHRPEGKDIDLYRFTLPTSGKVSIEVAAERLRDSSLLDSALRLYQRDGSGSWQEVSANDDYFSQDSYVELDLTAGDYIVGISAKGNQSYDPNIEDSGLGGRSEGKYQLRIDFKPPQTSLMKDLSGIPIDGDSDGRPGGTFDFWFVPNGPNEVILSARAELNSITNTLYIDNYADNRLRDSTSVKGLGTVGNPYRRVSSALSDLAAARAYPSAGVVANIGDFFKSSTGVYYRVKSASRTFSSGATEAIRIANDIRNGLVQKIDSIRLIGNGGADGNLATVADNVAYEIGFNRLGQAQADGGSFDVPKDITVMVDAGAILKLSRARIGVGSTTASVDRSGSAFQVLGTPRFIDSTGKVVLGTDGNPVPGSVYFTSLNDASLGKGINPDTRPPAATPGDWGGIDIRNQVDSTVAGRHNLESQGLFLNSIMQADIRFGGGQVVVDGVSQVITPIHMIDSRPTVANSVITRSSDAAMAATPNSFLESNFEDPVTQGTTPFISDFNRIGPSIHGNRLLTNSINGLFIKTRTAAASTTEVMTVPGRFDDTDIVHVVSENLIIQGSTGGANARTVAPLSTTVGFTVANVVTLTNGVSPGVYRYRFTYTEAGIESPASSPTASVTVQNNANISNGEITLSALPPIATTQRLNIYRTQIINGVEQPYRLLSSVGPNQTSFVDRFATPGAALPTTSSTTVASPVLASTFTTSAVPNLTTGIVAGTYAYQFRIVNGDGSESSSVQATSSLVVQTTPGVNNGRVVINNVPVVGANQSLRIYRGLVVNGTAPAVSAYQLVGVIPGSATNPVRTFTDVNAIVTLAPVVAPDSSITAPVLNVTYAATSQPGLTTGLTAGVYVYRYAFAGADGSESSLGSMTTAGNETTVNVTTTPGVASGQVVISSLPVIQPNLTLRVYRASIFGGSPSAFRFVGSVASGVTTFTDRNAVVTIRPVAAPDTAIIPPSSAVTLTPSTVPGISNGISAGSYSYLFAFASTAGGVTTQSASVPTAGNASTLVTVANTGTTANGRVTLTNLPVIPAGQSLLIYRAAIVAGQTPEYLLLTSVAGAISTYVDDRATPGAILDDQAGELNARLNGSLKIDPSIVVKLQGARIEVQGGAQLLAEGSDGQPIIMTSINDVRYGAGGTFDTANRGGSVAAAAGNWGGLYISQGSTGSLDYVRLSYGGGTTRIDGGFASFNVIEGHQADLRVAHSRIENNADGVEDAAPTNRSGRGTNFASAIFIRGSQPILVDNRITNNEGAALNIDVNSLNAVYVDDYGRSTGKLSKAVNRQDNQGPLVQGNRLSNNTLNGMVIRGQTLTTESVWDDTDIVHIVQDEIISSNLYTYGGLKLKSKPTESLVVKFGGGTAASTGLTATGQNLDISDRIGGSVQIIGQPNFPVILTSLDDDAAGAGFTPLGLPSTDTDNNGSNLVGSGVVLLPTGPEVNRGTLIDDDVAQTTPGFFSYQPEAGGGASPVGTSGITAQGVNQLFTNANVIFEYLNYIDVGADGGAVSLANTTITTPPTLVSPDLVVSEGSFVGVGGATVQWRVESRFDNGIAVLNNTLFLSSATALGNIRFINYLDEDVGAPSDDFMFTTGTPGQADFRAYTIDGQERIGFSHGGIYTAGTGLQNATYAGWTADQYPLLRTNITGIGTQYTVNGNINLANIPPFVDPVLGNAFGQADVTTAFAWDVNPTATSAVITSFLELIPQQPRQAIAPGAWRGLQFNTASNDRNVAPVIENELATSSAQSVNNIVSSAQYLGLIASSANSGDENARLGFQIQGNINRASDVDVYSFNAEGGTEIWLDIDRTSNSLDTVVELIDANGRILALSDDSGLEETDGSLLYRSSDIPASSVNSLRKTVAANYPTDSRGNPRDLYSTNPKDAGMRVVLPGTAGQTTLYHIRVRSSSSVGQTDAARLAQLVDDTKVAGGLSKGTYQLQVRLTEADEFPGSTVSFADIRYATTGIDLAGVPRHSPLLGETGETESNIATAGNNTFATAQELGNILSTDRATISLSGTLASATDVDWYTFTIDYQFLSTQLAQYFSTVFDVDYADGVGRPDTSIYVYDANGNLLTFGTNSNILDDRAGALKGADNTDLSRGSAGTLDPFIGSTALAAGRYFIAVTNQGRIPAALQIYTNPATANPLIRVQPSNNSQWIVEDRVGASTPTSAVAPIVPNFLPVGGANNSVVPFIFGDVALYLSNDSGFGQTVISIANPMTGTVTNQIGTVNQDFQDIAFRFNGDLRAFNGLEGQPAAADNDPLIGYWQINDGTAASTQLGSSNIQTRRLDLTGKLADADVGVEFEALTFANFGREVGVAVGNRRVGLNDGIQAARLPAARGTNVIYQFNADTGAAQSTAEAFNIVNPIQGGQDFILGNGTRINERGYIETNPAAGATSNSIAFTEATRVSGANQTTSIIQDGDSFVVNLSATRTWTFEFNSGPQFNLNLNPTTGPYLQDGDRFTMDGQVYEIQTDGTAVSSGAIAVTYDNSFSNEDFARSLQRAVDSRPVGATPITVGIEGSRINFSGAAVIQPIAGTSIANVITLSGNGTVGATRTTAVDFLAQDSQDTIAQRVAQAINGAGLGISATANGRQVTIIGGTLASANGSSRIQGIAPGGIVQGLAVVGDGRMFAVSDAGGLYQVNNTALVETPGNVGVYVNASSDLIGFTFTGLTAGPRNVEGGRYANLLFATTSTGQIVCFDTNGVLQPVFANGQSVVSTGIGNLNGLAFSTLDYNLFHATTNRANDAGHGKVTTPDGISGATAGGQSWYFGYDGTNPNATYPGATNPTLVPRFGGAPVQNTYNFPGGAIGVLESQPVSLANIVSADSPFFYFTYFSSAESVTARDVLRVRVMGDDGVWRDLATNDVGAGPSVFNNTAAQTTWRQARVSLAQFAGNENVRFRFEYSTGGGLGFSRGQELQMVAGSELRDGQTYVVGNQTYEVEMGPTVTVPNGSAIPNNSTITVAGSPFVFYDGTGPLPTNGFVVPYTTQQTSAQIAQALTDAFNNATFAIKPTIGSGLIVQEATISQDTIYRATATGINGRESILFTNSSGRIDPRTTAEPGDVDFYSADLLRGATVTTSLNANGYTPLVRVFDKSGAELAVVRTGNTATFTVPSDGTYYFGVSASSNSNYVPTVAATAAPDPNTGLYTISIDVTNALQAQVSGNRVQFSGGATLSVAGTPFTADGSVGVGPNSLPLYVTSDMTATQVASAVQSALVSAAANGSTAYNLYPQRGDSITLPGLNVSDQGPFSLNAPAANSNARSQNNAFEGIYLDDFVIGLAERGEIVSNSVPDTTFVANPAAVGNSINVGPYQLEIRGGEDYITATTTGVAYATSFDINGRLSIGSTLRLTNALNITDGDTITIGDGVNSLVFVFKDTALNTPVPAGQVAVRFSTAILNSVTGLIGHESAETIASRLRDLINSPGIQSRLKVTAISLTGATSGLSGDAIALSSNAIVTVPTIANRNPIATVATYRDRGDGNTTRDQGQVIIENSKISNSAQFGITIRPDARDTVSNAPSPGVARNTVVLNSERLAPGAVIVNNQLVGNTAGGISIVGDNTAGNVPLAAVPFARIVNNTIVGGTITQPDLPSAEVFGGFLFSTGTLAFADAVVSYTPQLSGGPVPAAGIDLPASALGSPNYSGGSVDPTGNQGAVALGNGGQLIVSFTDNILTGSGDSRPDLVIFEVGESERMSVAVSTNGTTFTTVGFVDGVNRTIDLDAFGFNASSRITSVRLIDDSLSGPITGNSVGADIDAVGALSSIPATTFTPGGTGIQVGANASPTLLNNIVFNNSVGLNVVANNAVSATTVVGGMLFQRNTNNLTNAAQLGQFPLVVPNTTELFVDPFNGLFYPAASSPAIDSSLDSLTDRASLVAVKQPLGLAVSPIITPTTDINGELRVDDPLVDAPAGIGQNVFKDRGSQDRSDFAGPIATIISPLDNDAGQLDGNPDVGVVALNGVSAPYFDIRLFDGSEQGSNSSGVGVDPSTVSGAAIVVLQDGVRLTEGVDYTFGYDQTSGIIRLTPTRGVWTSDAVYEVRFIRAGQQAIPLAGLEDTLDGTTYTIADSTGALTTFELDSGYRITVPSVVGSTTAQVTDGAQFSISDGSSTVIFEFDNDANFATGSIRVPFLVTDTPSTVIDSMLAAISSSGLIGVSANRLTTSSLQMMGTNATFTQLTSTLTVTGRSGVLSGTNGVPLNGNQITSAVDVATALANAIRAANLPGISVTQFSSNLLIEGAQQVLSTGGTVVQGIADRAGNPIRANRDSGETILTIQLGGAYDYGSAPDPTYKTLKASDGPRHLVVPGFSLGSGVTIDADAVNSVGENDGVVPPTQITSSYANTFKVTASGISAERPGYLNAWIDYNKNGVFEVTEQIAIAKPLQNGSNDVTVVIPGASLVGTTQARFRFSSTANLGSTGAANDGEVEDYAINIVSNPYRNAANAADVNGDGIVSSIDALQVINYLYRNGSSQNQLPNPRTIPGGFIDVNGDGFASAIDVLVVINTIERNRRNGEGESYSASTYVPASAAGSPVATSTQSASNSTNAALAPVIAPVVTQVVATPTSQTVPAPTAVTVSNTQNSVWTSVAADNSMSASWLDESDSTAIASSATQTSKSSGSPHDDVFANLEDFDL